MCLKGCEEFSYGSLQNRIGKIKWNLWEGGNVGFIGMFSRLALYCVHLCWAVKPNTKTPWIRKSRAIEDLDNSILPAFVAPASFNIFIISSLFTD